MLLASIHDVSPCFEPQVDRLVATLSATLGEGRFAMLVVPDFWGVAPLKANPRFAARLRAWASQGVEMFLHGWQHRDPDPRGFAARHLTGGEGEFAGIGRAAAIHLLRSGRSLLEDVTGQPVAGFVAPAWLYSPQARAALASEGFALAEDHFRVWQPASGRIIARGPVITWASRSPLRLRASLVAAAVLSRALVRQRTVRLAVHPSDTASPALMASIDASLTRLARHHAPGRYRQLAAGPPGLAAPANTPHHHVHEDGPDVFTA